MRSLVIGHLGREKALKRLKDWTVRQGYPLDEGRALVDHEAMHLQALPKVSVSVLSARGDGRREGDVSLSVWAGGQNLADVAAAPGNGMTDMDKASAYKWRRW